MPADKNYSINFLYRQKDRAQTDMGLLEVSSSTWALAWTYKDAVHPITSRLRINIVYGTDSSYFDPVSAEYEIWNEHQWKIIDTCFVIEDNYNSIESLEKECLFRAESFLTGKSLDKIKESHGFHEEDDGVNSGDNENTESEEAQENVLKLFPKK